MRQKNFLAHRKHQRRRKSIKAKVKAFEAKELKYEDLPILAKALVARKQRQAARTSVK